MDKCTIKALRNLNKLYRILGTWQAVADEIGRNRATVNKWFAGTKGISLKSRVYIRLAIQEHGR